MQAKGQKLNRENISLYAHLFFQNKQHIVQAQSNTGSKDMYSLI